MKFSLNLGNISRSYEAMTMFYRLHLLFGHRVYMERNFTRPANESDHGFV